MKSRVPLLDRITYYIVKRKGKQLRPMFVLYCARLCGGICAETYIAASMVELLHTAALVHDDVVDDAMTRRNYFSINALWKNKAAVLVGDYLLSKGLLIALENKQHRLLEVMSKAVRDMSEGELLQMEKSRSLDIDEATYFDIIRKKTASLISASCEAGAVSATKDESLISEIAAFGEKIGIAFQMKDDLFDYGVNHVGKPVGNDLKEKKMTLPLIYVLDRMDKSSRSRILKTIRKHHDDSRKMKEIIQLVRAGEGMQYTQDQMIKYKNEAISHLAQFSSSDIYEQVVQMVDYVIARKK
jgi:octaprenyl-diphosphate synthase